MGDPEGLAVQVVSPGGGSSGQGHLAARLRALREDRSLTQAQLARGLSVSVPTISSYENGASLTADRLQAYARFFASPRSTQGMPRRLRDDELTDEERASEQALFTELTALHAGATQVGRAANANGADPQPQLAGTWRFSSNENITIVSSELPWDVRQTIPEADPRSPDYVESYAYADLDALIEVHGHIRAANPVNNVHLRLPGRLTADDYSAHLVLLGGVDWNPAIRDVFGRIGLPVRQKARGQRRDVSCFEIDMDGKAKPFSPQVEDDGLHEDVGLLYRGRNPFNGRRTVTICSALYARGTWGVVRALTDIRVRESNERYLAERFSGEEEFGLLFRVPVVAAMATISPDWTKPDIRLYEWPPRTA